MATQAAKIAVFFNDQGGRLSAALDTEKLMSITAKAKGVATTGIVEEPFLDAFPALAQGAAQAEGIDRVLMVGGFTEQQQRQCRHILEELGINPYMVEWFDPRDQGLLNQEQDQALRDKKAAVMLKMVLARVKGLEPLEPESLPAVERVLIVGGGVSGIHAAASLTRLGKPVTLVEKCSGVGGKVAQLARFYPRMCDPRCGLEHVLSGFADTDLLELRTLATVEKIEGGPGRFQAAIRHLPRHVNERCDGCGLCQTVCPVELGDDIPPVVCEPPREALEQAAPPPQEEEPDAEAVEQEVDESRLRDPYGVHEEAPVERPAMFKRKAIHPALPMAFPVQYVVERRHCPPECRECERICPNKAVELEQEERVETVDAGAVLVTTGWDMYPLARLQEYGYGRYPGVIDNLEMERILSLDDPHIMRVNGRSATELQAVGFIQCAGSRDERHLPYCSSVCCSATMKQILELKRVNPDVACYVYYMHIRTPGFDESLYRQARESGAVFIKERPAAVEYDAASGQLVVEALDEALGRKVRAEFDLLVLAGGMCPSRGSVDAGTILDLPVNAHGFFETHKQCYPAESQRTGIYVGGCAREPMNVAQSIESSAKAALEALGFLGRSITVPPTYPVFNEKKCDQCGRCVEECPFSVLSYDAKNIPAPDLTKCRQCGNCMGICPKTAVNLRHGTIRQYASQVEVLGENMSFLPKKEPVILAFLCENDAWLAAREAQAQGLVPPNVVALKVRCAGALNNALIADALSMGVDGVYIGACPDETCHYVKGNQLIRKRYDDLVDKLKNMSMDPERVVFAGLGPRDVEEYVRSLEASIALLREKGPNPFKM
jgi:heterodisulfide reductase subunit A-like polyferredoxin/coenzyme F420-reducing hydrogenase delta subunit